MSTALSLYTIHDDLAKLLNTVDMVEGDADLEAILGDIAQKSQESIAKVDNTVRFLRHLELQQGSIATEIKRLQLLKRSYEAGQERVEKYVLGVIEQFVPQPTDKKGNPKGPRKLEGTIGVLAACAKPASVEITDENSVPDQFRNATVTMPLSIWREIVEELDEVQTDSVLKVDFSVQRTEIKKAIESGEEVPGADLKMGGLRLEVR
jgi:hypothetical protein